MKLPLEICKYLMCFRNEHYNLVKAVKSEIIAKEIYKVLSVVRRASFDKCVVMKHGRIHNK